MSYEKEIILIFKPSNVGVSPRSILDALVSKWIPTGMLIDLGNDFDWIEVLDQNKYAEILALKLENEEFIGFVLKHRENNRYVTVHLEKEKLTFLLDIERGEDEVDWFVWYHENLVAQTTLIKMCSKIEWRTGLDNRVIESFQTI